MDATKHKVVINKELNLLEAFIPLLILIALLAFNVFIFGDMATSGPNQFALLLGGAVAAMVGFYNKISFNKMLDTVGLNVMSTNTAVLILLMVGALSGTWMLSGIIPAMVYYGLMILSPKIFLGACVIICCIISLATGSSWTTSATIGIALIGIGKVIGIPEGMIAGAVISGAYFGDKMSPLSDTTNIAPAMAGTDLFTHIRYMALTTTPTIIITLIIFFILGFTTEVHGDIQDKALLLSNIKQTFNVHPLLFLVPAVVIALIVRKTPPLTALLVGTLLGGIFAVIFQPNIVLKVAGETAGSFANYYKGVMVATTSDIFVESGNPVFDNEKLFSAGGMAGMLSTIWLILCAMVFGGIMEAIGALAKISAALLSLAKGVFGLFASTVASCLAINITASDQYLALVVPGKMFQKAYREKGLAPENLSRTLEDSGTVTSVLVPWNTCGAYQSGVLGVSTFDYLGYAVFNYLSPFTTLLFAALRIKIRHLQQPVEEAK